MLLQHEDHSSGKLSFKPEEEIWGTSKGGVLSIDRAYFDITGGRERWLCRVARKHAGGAGEGGFAISMLVLFGKSGAEGQYCRFKFEMIRLAEKDDLLGYAFKVGAGRDGEPMIRMTHAPGKGVPEVSTFGAGGTGVAESAESQSGNPPAPELPLGAGRPDRSGAGNVPRGNTGTPTMNPPAMRPPAIRPVKGPGGRPMHRSTRASSSAPPWPDCPTRPPAGS